MSILRFLGFYKVNASSEDEQGIVIDKHTFWEWGFSFRIPFTRRDIK